MSTRRATRQQGWAMAATGLLATVGGILLEEPALVGTGVGLLAGGVAQGAGLGQTETVAIAATGAAIATRLATPRAATVTTTQPQTEPGLPGRLGPGGEPLGMKKGLPLVPIAAGVGALLFLG